MIKVKIYYLNAVAIIKLVNYLLIKVLIFIKLMIKVKIYYLNAVIKI